MSFELTGKIIEIFNEQLISDKFRKREFIVEYKDTPGSMYPQILKFQFTGDKCNTLDQFKQGQDVSISFNLRGRKYQKDGRVSYFMDLEAWKMVPANTSAPVNNDLPSYDTYVPEEDDANGGLPF